MKPREEEIAVLCQRMVWYLAQAEEYDSGKPEIMTENGIVAADRCARMAAKYRAFAQDLAVLIDAYKQQQRKEFQRQKRKPGVSKKLPRL